jgi:hypothetical protein
MMATLANLYLAIGSEIGDRFNAEVPQPRLLVLINRAIKDLARDTNCLWDTRTISGQYDIKILDYTGVGRITIQTSDDSSSTDYAWSSVTSNSVSATNLATALTAHANVVAYAVNEHVYVLTKYIRAEESADITISTLTLLNVVTTGSFVTGVSYTILNVGDTTWTDIGASSATIGVTFTATGSGDGTTGTATTTADSSGVSITSGATKFNLETIISNFRKMKNISVVGGDIFHVSFGRQQYDTALSISTGLTANFYSIVPESGTYQMYFKHNGADLAPATVITMNYLLHPTALSAVTDSPPGILDDFDDAVISRTMYYYMRSSADYRSMILQKQIADDTMKDIRYELRSQGEIQSITHFQKWY